MDRQMISVLIITKDEEKMIRDCIASVKWADEVIVIDTGSSDKTIDISKRMKAKVYEYKKETGTFSDWRNFAAKKAKHEWILYIDADERVPDALKEEITTTLKRGNHSLYAIPRENVILGKVLRHGGWYPDYVKRLIKKDSLKAWKGDLHENPEVSGSMGHLSNSLTHIKHESIAEMIEKTNAWSEIEGKLMFESNHPPMNIRRFLTAMGREFIDRMVKKRAFLDGPTGIIFAMYQVFSRFVSYAKLWELQVINESSNR